MEAIFGLIGVVLGAFLAAGYDYWKEAQLSKRLLRDLRRELQLNLNMIAPKKDVLRQAMEQIKVGRLMPTKTVHFSSTIFDNYFDKIYSSLSSAEIDSLYFIREHMRIIDSQMDTLLDDLKADLDRKDPPEVQRLYLGLTSDLIDGMERLDDLLKKHIQGSPVDVFGDTRESILPKS